MPSCENKSKKMLLHCNAIKKYSLRFKEDNVVCISEVCLDSGYLILQWLAHRATTRQCVFPHGSTPPHLWGSLVKKSSPNLVSLLHLTTIVDEIQWIGAHFKWHQEMQSAKPKLWKNLIGQETWFLWLKIGRKKEKRRKENQNNRRETY